MKNGALTKPENSCCPPTERLGDPTGRNALGYAWTNEFNRVKQKQIETLTAQLKEQAAQIEKVSAQLDASKPALQVVNNP